MDFRQFMDFQFSHVLSELVQYANTIDPDTPAGFVGVLRKVWCKSIEDLGLQYDVINYLDVVEDRIDLNQRFKVIILPKTVCLSDREAGAFRNYVEKGGLLDIYLNCAGAVHVKIS